MATEPVVITLTEVRPTKRMVIYEAPDGKETIVPIYLSQQVLMAHFKHIPTSIRITVEATDA